MVRDIDDVGGDVLGAAYRIHSDRGPGLLERVYETVLAGKLAAMGYAVARQRAVDIEYEGLRFEAAFRIDLLMDERLIVEIKSVERLTAAHMKHRPSASPRLRVN